jgi:hypothetical protein
MAPNQNSAAEIGSVSISDIPEIKRRTTTTNFSELDARLKASPNGRAIVLIAPKTKKGELNRQYATKLAKRYKEKGYTIVSRMGEVDLKQDTSELYIYLFKTPAESKSA